MRILGWSLSVGRLRGVNIRFHFSLVFCIPIAFLLFRPNDLRSTVEALLWVGGFLLFIFLHEMGHAVAAQMVGVNVKSVVVWLMGGFTNLAYKPEKPMHNFFIYAAGPLMNMLLAFLCVAAYMSMIFVVPSMQNDHETFIWLQTFQNLSFSLAILNLLLILFNLLPIYPLDGGNILHAGMEWLFGKSNADTITLVVSIPFLLLLILFGVFARDYILLFFCILIAISIGTLNRSVLRWINLGANYLFKRPGYYYLLGDYERAAQLYTQAIEKQPDAVGNYLARGGSYLMMGYTERAQADVERVLKLHQGHTFALQLRGELYMLEKNYEAALELFAQAQALNPHWSLPYFDRASVLMDRKQYQAALDEFNKAIALQSRMPLFYVVRSLAHYRLGNLEAAHNDQDIAVQLSPDDSLVMVELNQILYKENLDWAADYYERQLKQNPRNVLALQGYADACLTNQDFSHAVDLYTRALALNPKEPRLYLGRGEACLGLNQPQTAKADFIKVTSVTEKLHLKRQAELLMKDLPALDHPTIELN
ncbi:MAG TPA: M50 family metallopeptidase [Anaerolineales bacterium]|nr:M50 family metallopeptidase [Anaerolineales bacterium]